MTLPREAGGPKISLLVQKKCGSNGLPPQAIPPVSLRMVMIVTQYCRLVTTLAPTSNNGTRKQGDTLTADEIREPGHHGSALAGVRA